MTIWTVLLAVLGSIVLLTLLIPVTRRMWVFNLYLAKYFLFWLLDITRLRKLWFKITGRRYVKLTRPLMARLFCEDMGPTFIKFGQLIASSAGLFPERYVVEFKKCLDRVRPFDFQQVQRIIRTELGDSKFGDLTAIEPKQIASASIAQVHAAELRDGTKVVIKVQREGIEKRIVSDMKILRLMARIAARLVKDAELGNPVGVVDDFSETIREELDFRLEAKNLDRFNEIMAELGHSEIRAPVPHWELITQRVLVMERFFGTRVDAADEIRARGIDAEERLVTGLRAWFQCVVLYGFFHGDVHAGNLMLLDNEDLGFLDFGIVGRFDDHERWMVTDYILAFSTGDYKKLAEVIIDMGGATEDVDQEAFANGLKEAYAPMLKLAFGDLNFAELLPGIQKVASEHRMFMPKEFVLITKQLLYFDRYAKLLAPKLNIFRDPRLLMSLMGDIQTSRAQYQEKHGGPPKSSRAGAEA